MATIERTLRAMPKRVALAFDVQESAVSPMADEFREFKEFDAT